MPAVWTTLEGWRVASGSPSGKAVLLRKGEQEAWVPRSVAMDGDDLMAGDTDIVVKTWFAEKEGLD